MTTVPCPICGEPCDFTLRPDTPHHGAIRCPVHGFRWIPKPSEGKRKPNRANKDLRTLLPLQRNSFCWQCRREESHLASLHPSVGLEVHHIIEVVEGGTDDPANLQLLCKECHSEVHRRREAFRRYQGPT